MNDRQLDFLPLRVERDGRWQSLYVQELDYLTTAEIADLRWSDRLLGWLRLDPRWTFDAGADRWVNAAPAGRIVQARKLAEHCRVLFEDGVPAEVSGAVLAELTGLWLSGWVAPLREQVLTKHVSNVWEIVGMVNADEGTKQ